MRAHRKYEVVIPTPMQHERQQSLTTTLIIRQSIFTTKFHPKTAKHSLTLPSFTRSSRTSPIIRIPLRTQLCLGHYLPPPQRHSQHPRSRYAPTRSSGVARKLIRPGVTFLVAPMLSSESRVRREARGCTAHTYKLLWHSSAEA